MKSLLGWLPRGLCRFAEDAVLAARRWKLRRTTRDYGHACVVSGADMDAALKRMSREGAAP